MISRTMKFISTMYNISKSPKVYRVYKKSSLAKPPFIVVRAPHPCLHAALDGKFLPYSNLSSNSSGGYNSQCSQMRNLTVHCEPNIEHRNEPKLNLATRDILRRLSPRDTSLNLNRITSLVPDLTEDLLSSVDQPLETRRCAKSGRDYLLCDYNRDSDSYRSPWSNEFNPPVEDATFPSERIRKLEIAANEAFEVYRELYYEGGVGSTYFWDLDDGFAGVVLLKKGTDGNELPVV